MTPLETLIDQQAKLLERMNMLLARDVQTEFTRGEAQPKVSAELTTGAKLQKASQPEYFIQGSANGTPGNPLILSVDIVPICWYFRHLKITIGLGDRRSGYPAIKIEFANDADFTKNKTEPIYPFYNIFSLNVSSFTVNTGNQIMIFQEQFPVRYRFCRLTPGFYNVGTSTARFTPDTWSDGGTSTGACPPFQGWVIGE